ncbi:cytochrome P450 81Q32 [Lactuca sativa]|uniref:Cytochrome P450 n=1 Tax=Lactuca sativa TaxID=4236 RepID=A0A9R1XW17_LACSA|nr:cytochrome P450 81Q32 [Lactuca sativa]KAJ0228276.1 hypothetical protein LSAT_V11C100009650 [Lactuca sativa]
MGAFYFYFSLTFLAISAITNYFLRKFQNLPPTPWLPPLPIIGHLYLLKRPLHKSLAKISARYGPVQLLQIGSRRVLVVSSPSAAEECLTKNDIIFANRPRQLLAGKYLGYNYDSLVYAPYGDHWRNLRRVTTLEILSSHRLREFEPIRADEVRLMIRKLYRSWSGEAVEVQVNAMLVDLTLNAVMRMVSGKRYYYGKDDILTDEEKEKAHRFQEIVEEVFCAMSVSHIGDYLPILRWLGVSKLEKQLIALQAKRDLFMKELVEEIRCSMKNSGKRNMIQVLLSLQQTEPECYTDEMIRSIMLTILAGGTHTSICTLEWAMSLLVNNPSVLKKAHNEINSHVGHDRCVEESDMVNLPYLACIIKETLRMYPAGPLLPHESSKDCMVSGYHVPRGTMLLVNAWGIQNDPNIWGDPETFRPERFEGVEVYGDGFKLLPFGFGRRSCPGENMAMRMVGLALGSLIQCFEWGRTSKAKVDMNGGTGIALAKTIHLVAMCQPRPIMLNLLSQL